MRLDADGLYIVARILTRPAGHENFFEAETEATMYEAEARGVREQ